MKMDYKLSRIIVLGIAVIYILLGVAQAKFGVVIHKNVSSGLLIVAVIIFFVGRKTDNTSGDAENKPKEEAKAEEIAENNEEKKNDIKE